ncbi:MAG: tyrosine-protein phosphatase, partial [Clostridia bacterium]|nr:tyrosine-protein phosphatase [Clostridia bacterium]
MIEFKKIVCVIVAAALCLAAVSCGGTGGETAYDSGESLESVESTSESAESTSESLESTSETGSEEEKILEYLADIYSPLNADFNLTNRKNGATVDILPQGLTAYLSADTPRKQANILYNHFVNDNSNYFDKSNITLSWNSTGAAKYTVYIADNAYLTGAATLEVNTNSCNVGFLIPGKTYYYRVADSENRRSDGDYFKVSSAYLLRNISAGNAFNMRDLGGWKTEDGKQVKYGLVFRSGRFDDLATDSDKTREAKHIIIDILGVKTEIDLRNGTSGNSKPADISYIGAQNFVKCPMEKYSMLIPGFIAPPAYNAFSYSLYPNSADSVKAVFETLADENNYPVSYHCSGGADRTGSISFLLNGLLGVSYDDLMRDYELTSFSKSSRRWRSAIVDGDFDDTG